MSLLKDYAIRAFHEGSDKFGERPTGEVVNLVFSEVGKYFHITVLLIETYKGEEHSCTSGIGFYPNATVAECTELRVMSGHWMPWTVKVTDELREELLNANVEK